jgi:hypothetical protein
MVEQKLLASAASLAVGATLAEPGVFPDGFAELGISQRAAPRNQYLGVVTTRPDEETYVFGLNYFDVNDNCDNEDMYKFDAENLDVTPYMRGTFEQEYPEYAGHHHAAKAYLRKPSGS